MKKVKALVAILLVVSMLCAFVACSSKSNTQGVPVTQIVTDDGGEAVTNDDGTVVTEVVTDAQGSTVTQGTNNSSNSASKSGGNSSNKTTTAVSKNSSKTTAKSKSTTKKQGKNTTTKKSATTASVARKLKITILLPYKDDTDTVTITVAGKTVLSNQKVTRKKLGSTDNAYVYTTTSKYKGDVKVTATTGTDKITGTITIKSGEATGTINLSGIDMAPDVEDD